MLLQQFLSLSLKGFHHYHLLESFLPSLGDFVWPEAGVESAEVQTLGAGMDPWGPRVRGLRSSLGNEMAVMLSQSHGVWMINKPICQSPRSCYHDGLWCMGEQEVPFQLPHPLLTKRDLGHEWDTLLITESRTRPKSDLLAQCWRSSGGSILGLPWRQLLVSLRWHDWEPTKPPPEPLRKILLAAPFILPLLWVRCWVKNFPCTVCYHLPNIPRPRSVTIPIL